MDRNFEHIQFETIRKRIDGKYNSLHDELTECYYKFWKKGLSKPFQGYDVQKTPEESKELFDKLHGLLFTMYSIEFVKEYNDEKLLNPELKDHNIDLDAENEKILTYNVIIKV